MYMLKVCHCCDAIIGELETDDSGSITADFSVEVAGNVAYTICPRCMQELAVSDRAYYN